MESDALLARLSRAGTSASNATIYCVDGAIMCRDLLQLPRRNKLDGQIIKNLNDYTSTILVSDQTYL